MSRSFKKCPGFYDRSPFMKSKANEKVRHTKDLPNGMGYKKVFESWNIHDYKRHIDGRYDLVKWNHDGKWPCFKELQQTDDYRRARMK